VEAYRIGLPARIAGARRRILCAVYLAVHNLWCLRETLDSPSPSGAHTVVWEYEDCEGATGAGDTVIVLRHRRWFVSSSVTLLHARGRVPATFAWRSNSSLVMTVGDERRILDEFEGTHGGVQVERVVDPGLGMEDMPARRRSR
jgi:hypothetical protein